MDLKRLEVNFIKNTLLVASSRLDYYNDYQLATQICRIFYDVHRKEYEEEITEEHGCSVFDVVFLTTQNNSESRFQKQK